MSDNDLTSNRADFSQLEFAYGEPLLTARLKNKPEDFVVEEFNDFELSGEGEHLWCWVEKTSENTDWVASILAKWANTSKRNIGFAGQKDRNAVTRQWFSIHLPGKPDPVVVSLSTSNVHIVKTIRHNRKLQRGGLSGNRFQLRLRDIRPIEQEMSVQQMQDWLSQRLQLIESKGVPNYFGEQRFGRNGNNLIAGEKLVGQTHNSGTNNRRKGRGRNQQSLYISALRSWMFNDLLSQRIQLANWNSAISGDVIQLNNSDKWFVVTDDELVDIQQRVNQFDLHPTGGLFGDGVVVTEKTAKELELAVMAKYEIWCQGLAARRIKQDRRALRVMVDELNWHFLEDDSGDGMDLSISFKLTSGSYATMVLRELLLLTEPKR